MFDPTKITWSVAFVSIGHYRLSGRHNGEVRFRSIDCDPKHEAWARLESQAKQEIAAALMSKST